MLLRRVNDSAQVLSGLSGALFDCRVLPCCLHLLDRATGAAHFEVLEARAREIYAGLLGYLVPKLVREVAGEPSKTPMYGGILASP